MPEYAPPARPIAATIAVVIRDEEVLLVRRANPPDAGRWGFPGGKIDRGERLPEAALRELREETGVDATAVRVFTAVDAFDHDPWGQLSRHFVLIAVLCRWTGGEPVAGDDALAARWVRIDGLKSAGLAMSMGVAELASEGATLMMRSGS